MNKQKQIIIYAVIGVVFIAAVLLSYNLGVINGSSQENTKVVKQLGSPSIRYEYKIYPFLTDVEDIPEGYTVKGQVSYADDHVVCRAGDDIYASDDNPYCIYTKEHPSTGGNGYNLFVTAPLCYDLVMYNGYIYENRGGIGRIDRENFDEDSYKYVGKVENIDRTAIPNKDYDSNIKGADKIFMGETEDTIYVKVIEFDEYHYIKLIKSNTL
jgi:hypothetical protein